MKTRNWYLAACFLFSSSAFFAQTFWEQIPEGKQNIIETISLYSSDQRTAVLKAILYPEILVRMGNIRSNTEQLFKQKMNGVQEEDQKRIYNVTRYPDLMNAITNHGRARSSEEMKNLLKDFPAEIQEDASFVNQHYYNLFVEINQLYRDANDEFQQVIKVYPPDISDAYTNLSRLPEIVSLLSENLDIVVLLGEAYRKHPDIVSDELDSLNVEVAEARTRDLNDWKKELEENPEARKEYEQSANEFAGSEVYDDDVYVVPEEETHAKDVYVHFDWNYYPYWFGWPAWYGYECWYPYPWWYHWGFYYGPSHVMVIWGFPSDVFMYWQLYYPHHMYHYPHYTDHIIRHYYGPRHPGSVVQPVYRQWEDQHKRELPANWFNDDANRVERIREYGKFKMDYQQTVQHKTDKSPTQWEYLKKNSNRYPTLKPVITENPEPRKTQPAPPRDYNPGQVKQPQQNPPRDIEPYKTKPTQQNKPPRDPAPSKKESAPSQPGNAPPSQKAKDQTQPPPTQPRKDG